MNVRWRGSARNRNGVIADVDPLRPAARLAGLISISSTAGVAARGEKTKRTSDKPQDADSVHRVASSVKSCLPSQSAPARRVALDHVVVRTSEGMNCVNGGQIRERFISIDLRAGSRYFSP